MARRTDEFRVRAILRAEELGNISAAARELGISESTLRRWKTGEKRPEVAKKAAQVKESMLQRLEVGAMRFFDDMMQKLDEGRYTPGQLMTGFGIIADKVIMLQRQQETPKDATALMSLVRNLAELRRRRDELGDN